MAGNLLLLAAALVSAVLMFRQTEDIAGEQSLLLKVSSLALAFVAMAALGRLTLTESGQDIETLQRMLNNLALYAALPLLATAMLGQVMQWHWSRAGWGRWLLTRFALVELCRRMQLGEAYTLVMGVLVGLILVGAALRLHGLRARLCSAISGVLLGLSICGPLLPVIILPELALNAAQAAALLLFTLALQSQTQPTPSPQ